VSGPRTADALSRAGGRDLPGADPAVPPGPGPVTPGPVTEIGQAIAPVGASWRGIDGTPAPVHAHMVQW
jgi:hypothetical protein